MNYVFLFLTSLAFTVSSGIILTYYNIKINESKQEIKEEGNSFIKSELNNMHDLCPNDGDSLDNYSYSKTWNYNNNVDFVVSCDNNAGVVDFSFKGCRPKYLDSDKKVCFYFFGES